MSLFTSSPSSICILRLSAIGDVCHAVAAVQAIQRHWPETRVTWVVGKNEYTLLEGLKGINFVTFDKKAGFAGMRDVWKKLRHERFDALLHMQLALRASVLSLGIKAKHRVGFHRQRAKEGQWIFTNRKIQDVTTEHVLDSFYAFIEDIGVAKSQPSWNMPVAEADQNYANQLLAGLKDIVVIAPSASKAERAWLPKRYAQFADYVHQSGYQVVLCGTADPITEQLVKQIQHYTQTDVLNLIGKTNLKQLAATLKCAKVVLAPDSGPAHLATTQGVPVIGLYAHSNPKRTGPYKSIDFVVNAYQEIVQEQYQCPAELLPWGTRVKGEHLMQRITLADVIEQFERIKQTL